MHGDGMACAEGLLQHPLRGRWPGGLAALPFLLVAFLLGDPPPSAFEVLLLDSFEEAQHVEPGRLIAHTFDSMIAAAYRNPGIEETA
jgi:hypothetical protein